MATVLDEKQGEGSLVSNMQYATSVDTTDHTTSPSRLRDAERMKFRVEHVVIQRYQTRFGEDQVEILECLD